MFPRWSQFMFITLGVALLLSPTVNAQSDPKDQTFAALRSIQKKLGPDAILSGGVRSLFNLAGRWDSFKGEFTPAGSVSKTGGARRLATGKISAPPDFGPPSLTSRLRSFTANESTTAWCGKNVVVGYNDTESLPKSFAASGGAMSILGYSVSHNKGVSFSDMGYPTLSSDPSSFLGLDQVMTCSSAQNFYFSSLNFTATRAGVSVSASIDGGRTFAQPVVVASASLSGHIFDGDWMAVNPANPNQLFVSYTDDDVTFTACPTALGTSIELVNSNDGGNTWSSPQTVAGEVCLDSSSATPGAVEFSGIAVDPLAARVYVTWENLVPKSLDRGINISSAAIPATPSPTPFGLSFSNAVKISSVNYAGTLDMPESGAIGAVTALFQGLQGRIFTLEHPELAIGKGPKNTGVLYVTWNDGANAVADAFSINGTYQFTDVLLTSSTDGGNSWSKPVRVNNDVEDGVTHPFTDQFHPTVATDKTGAIAVCFYDRRNDPLNFLIGRYCATSTDGKTWSNFAIDPKGGPSIVNQDDAGVSDWLGDYETLATDSLDKSAGFVGGYTNTSAGYENIRENKFSSEEE